MEICESCKNKLIDFYHYRKRSQLIQTIQGSMSSQSKYHIIQENDLQIENKLVFDTMFIVRSFIGKQEISSIEIKKSVGGSGLIITSRNKEDESNKIVPKEEPELKPEVQYIQSILNSEFTNEDTSVDSLTEDRQLNVDGMVLINYDFTTAATLEQMLELEEKTIMPSFKRNKVLTDSEKDCVCRAIIKCLLKNNPAKLLQRQEFNTLSKILVDLFEENSTKKASFFQYWDKLKEQLNNFRKEYSDAGLLNVESRRPRT